MLRFVSHFFAIPKGHPQGWLFAAFAALSMIAILASVHLEKLWLAGIPAAILVAWLSVVDLRKIFFLMMACIPLSMERALPGGFATDIPSEQLMWLLTLAGGAWFCLNWRSVDVRFLRHPVSLALFAHLAWITVCAASSQDFFVSFKYLLAKGWYVVVFYFLAARFLQTERDFKNLLWWFFLPLLVIVLRVLVRHAAIGFSFEEVGYVMGPFFRNHVMYACVLAIFLPFVWYGAYWYRRFSLPWWILAGGVVVFLVGINFAYTRAAYVALVAAIGIYWCIHRGLLKLALIAFALALTLFFSFLNTRDNWLMFAPEYEKAVTHKRFENLLEATTKLEDISTMERVYRWVAASYMVQEKPMVGFGPGTFYFYYKNYTVSSFKTYVSANPERSGIHNYFLMVAVEQGLPGLVIFLVFCLVVMLKGEQIYHQTKDLVRRRVLLAALLCFILTNLLMLMNDFVETDKIGSLFFLSVAILVNIDLKNRELQQESTA